ncbi:MAG: fumarylacetoacetate hydrolase family protein [Proteobacteria bacterium]|nr:fumarylacetoacetate hydrolase family protein [Pseudomonadota bacterium]MCH9050237.1 fumarylacetoacetate hydrolase family protein [Pseudomonadota bacterium]
MSYAIPCPPVPTVPIPGSSDVFPVRRIYCVGRNYAAHAREMGHDPDREPPFYFMKPADAILPGGSVMPYPSATSNLHHEIELVVGIGKTGRDIPVARALEHVFGYAVGLDMTRRDLQGEAKEARRPWDMGKGFDHSAPCSAMAPASDIGHPEEGAIRLKVNGETRQEGDLGQLIWSVPETISHLSHLVTLVAGDLIYSGTPAGVGAVERGDKLEGHVDGVGDLTITIGD